MTEVLIIGATGFIGGSVLSALLAEFPDLHVSVLVRKASDHPALHKLSPSIRIISGDKSDHGLLRSASAAADVVISAADNDDVELVRAVIGGLEQRARQGASRTPVLISTSGTGVLGEGSDGNFREGKPVDDSKTEDIQNIPADRTHRAVDLEVFGAQARGHILTYIISPAAVYGPGRGPVRKTSKGLHLLVQLTMKHGGSPVVNSGTAIWADVHIDDVVDLYVRMFRKALDESRGALDAHGVAHSAADQLPTSAFERYYFAVGHTMTWASWARTIAQAMIARGKIDAAATQPVSVTLEQEPYMWWAATNVRPVAKRAELELGWRATHPSFEDTLETELEALLAPMLF